MISLWRIGLTDWHYANRRGLFVAVLFNTVLFNTERFIAERVTGA